MLNKHHTRLDTECNECNSYVLNNKVDIKLDRLGVIAQKYKLFVSTHWHLGNYPRCLLNSESKFLHSFICLIIYLSTVMELHLLGKKLYKRISVEFSGRTNEAYLLYKFYQSRKYVFLW